MNYKIKKCLVQRVKDCLVTKYDKNAIISIDDLITLLLYEKAKEIFRIEAFVKFKTGLH